MFANKTIHPEMIDATSKLSLRLSCIRSCNNDIGRARELYDFLAEGLDDIPAVPPINPDGFSRVKQSASDIFSWISSHRDDIAQGIAFVQSLKPKAAATPNVPPIVKP